MLNDNKPYDVFECNNLTFDMLKQQKVLDIEKERKEYAQAMLESMSDMMTDKTKFEEMKNNFSTVPFNGVFLEYTFLKSICNRLNNTCNPISYSKYVSALNSVFVSEKMDIMSAQKQTDKIIEKTKRYTYDKYAPFAKNEFYELSRKDFNRREEVRQIWRKKFLNPKRKENTKQETKEKDQDNGTSK